MFLLKQKLSPNQYYLLLCYKDKVAPVLINEGLERRQLQNGGWLLENNKLSGKATKLLEEAETFFTAKKKKVKKEVLGDDAATFVSQYRMLFPTGKLPSGAPSRWPENELAERFTWFFNNYQGYDWDTVIEATKLYIQEYEQKGYLGMRNSGYFIFKQDKNRVITSDLAKYCTMVEDGEGIDDHGPQMTVR
jgi:hypothetical protein